MSEKLADLVDMVSGRPSVSYSGALENLSARVPLTTLAFVTVLANRAGVTRSTMTWLLLDVAIESVLAGLGDSERDATKAAAAAAVADRLPASEDGEI